MSLEHESITQHVLNVNLELRDDTSYTKHKLEIKSYVKKHFGHQDQKG